MTLVNLLPSLTNSNVDDRLLDESQSISRVESESKADEKEEDEDDFGIEVLSYPPAQKNSGGAAEIENDDDDDGGISQPVQPSSNIEEHEADKRKLLHCLCSRHDNNIQSQPSPFRDYRG